MEGMVNWNAGLFGHPRSISRGDHGVLGSPGRRSESKKDDESIGTRGVKKNKKVVKGTGRGRLTVTAIQLSGQ